MSEHFEIRPITPADNAAMARIIRTVMPEFGASGEGFAIMDPEVDSMAETYSRPRHAYFVLTRDDAVVGGGGVGPLAKADPAICELRKMYFLPETRGRGLGERLLRRCLEAAREFAFRQCYLETLTGMDAAQKLYQRVGFLPIPKALGSTGHFGCNRFYLLDL